MGECQGLGESKFVQHQLPNFPKRVQPTTTTPPESSEAEKIAERELQLSKQTSGGKPGAVKGIPSLDFSELPNPQRDGKSMKLLSDSVLVPTGGNAPWPTKPSDIRMSLSRAKLSPPGQQSESYFSQGSILSAVESHFNPADEEITDVNRKSTEKGQQPFPQPEEVRWSLSSIYRRAAQLSTVGNEVMEKQASDETEFYSKADTLNGAKVG